MKKDASLISAHIWTAAFLGTERKAAQFLELIDTMDGGIWKPDKWSQFEPIRNAYSSASKQQILEDWCEVRGGRTSNIILFKSRRSKLLLNVTSWRGRVPDLNKIWFDIDASLFTGPDGVERLKRSLMALVNWSEGVYATVYHSAQFHKRSASGTPIQRLERLDWLTYLGNEYLALFGEERIGRCPFYSKQRTGCGELLVAAPSPNAPEMTNSDELLLTLEQCLGSEFFASDAYPEVECRTPRFDLAATVIADAGAQA